MSVELIIKSSIYGLGGKPRSVHDLKLLVNQKIGKTSPIAKALNRNNYIKQTFSRCSAVWDMDLRYQSVEYSALDIEQFIEDFGRFREWIKNEFGT